MELADLQRIQNIINKKVNTLLALHNGSCEAVSFEDGILGIKLHGGCAGCPSSQITLFNMVLPIIKENHPEVLDIILV